MINFIHSGRFLALSLIGSVMLLVGAGTARAEDWCTRQFRHDQHELDKAIAHHGVNSRQAEHARWELARLRDRCGYREGYRDFR